MHQLNLNPNLQNQEQEKPSKENLKSSFFERGKNGKLYNSQLQREVAINRDQLRWHGRAILHGALVPLCCVSFSFFPGVARSSSMAWGPHATSS